MADRSRTTEDEGREPLDVNEDAGWPAPTCWTCRYWTRNNGRITTDDDAECRRHAPIPMTYRDSAGETPALNAAWPVTDMNDWCGDHLSLPGGSANVR